MRALRLSISTALLAAAVLSPPRSARGADVPDLRADEWRAAGITLGALALDGLMLSRWKPASCTICSTDGGSAGAGARVNALDDAAQDALAWTHPAQAQRASDLLANAAIPVLAAADAVRATGSWGDAGRDVLVVAEAASLSTLSSGLAKDGFARLRPGRAPTAHQGAAAYQSMWSGHAALAFPIVVAQAMQDTVRRDPAAPWVWAVGLTLASGVGYLRVAGSAHWLTDVLAGAAVGSAFGVAVPLAERRLVRGVTLAPAPGGFALRF